MRHYNEKRGLKLHSGYNYTHALIVSGVLNKIEKVPRNIYDEKSGKDTKSTEKWYE